MVWNSGLSDFRATLSHLLILPLTQGTIMPLRSCIWAGQLYQPQFPYQLSRPNPTLAPRAGCDQQGRDCFIYLTELSITNTAHTEMVCQLLPYITLYTFNNILFCLCVFQQLHSSVRTGNLETCLRLLSLGAQANFFHPVRKLELIHALNWN